MRFPAGQLFKPFQQFFRDLSSAELFNELVVITEKEG